MLTNRYDGVVEKEDFFSLIRHYERYFLQINFDDSVPGYVPVGEDGPPNQELIRFNSVNSQSFELNKITSDTQSCGKQRLNFLVSFLGLIGPSGVLPQHYTKLALERQKFGDFAMTEFINLFEHRLLSLYYKAWCKHKISIQYESSKKYLDDDTSRLLKGFSGFSYGHQLQLFFSGHFSKNNRSVTNLRSILQELINEEVHIRSFVGRWLPIHERDRCQTGRFGRNHQLGAGVILGDRYWDVQSKIIIEINNITMEKFKALDENQALYQLLSYVVNAYVPTHIDVAFEFFIDAKHRGLSQLGSGLQLSKNLWLMSHSENQLVSKRTLKRR